MCDTTKRKLQHIFFTKSPNFECHYAWLEYVDSRKKGVRIIKLSGEEKVVSAIKIEDNII